jgi:FAD/FMN-containing dehydrogenase
VTGNTFIAARSSEPGSSRTLMRALKRTLDLNGIMNAGKVLAER